MITTDPVADMLTRIRNAGAVYHEKVDIPTSKLKLEIARILKEEGYIKDYQLITENNHQMIRVFLKYGDKKRPVIAGLKRISKPGLRVYAGANEIPKVLGGLGTAIISTSKGVMTDRDARKLNVGGEVLCFIW
ncbi:MAG: 30S ribosomal protein S8 [Bacillota bacterium]|jgi:small subunit ribosomal protein S8|nr:30S ribosomal protein S8 [Bacillota bacterium]HOA90474.1 30S ribosomal protein S8 [Bacillota bacterium]HPT61367.1 30S ribosomal protein S8 [Bacillota bacterium]HPZ72598.1 30S ribosomal protein S8 [Bacillota bacterium]HQD77214.1 30S ribosomal protein S8 [Bacillota bacterium]